MRSSNDKKIAAITLTIILTLGIIPSMSSAFAFPPERELCIALDRSGSIGAVDWTTVIVPGVKAALEDPTVQAGLVGKMVRMTLISYSTDTVVELGPSDMNTLLDVQNFADQVTIVNLPFTGGGTNIEDALTLCEAQFSYFAGADQVIDIVTDGKPTVIGGVFSPPCDAGAFPTACDVSTLAAGTAVRALGVDKINILAIGDQVSPPFNAALTAPGGIVFPAANINGFLAAFIAKLKIEITETPVGGAILPIDNYSLVIAGLSTNALWILPALAAVAGTSFALVRFQVSQKNN